MLENTENTGVKVAVGWPAGVFVMLIIFFKHNLNEKLVRKRLLCRRNKAKELPKNLKTNLKPFC